MFEVKRRLPWWAATTVLLLAAGGPASGDQEAVFLDGRTLPIRGHRIDGDQITLELDGGGRLTLPRSRVRAIRVSPGSGNPAAPADRKAPAPPALAEPLLPPPAPVPAGDLFSQIADLALRNGLDTDLVTAVILVESGLDPQAESPKGAKGLMQLMPLIATHYGVKDPFDPGENLEGGISHLKVLLDRYDGDLEIALAAYNAGDGAVERHGGVPPYPETQRFVQRVLALIGTR